MAYAVASLRICQRNGTAGPVASGAIGICVRSGSGTDIYRPIPAAAQNVDGRRLQFVALTLGRGCSRADFPITYLAKGPIHVESCPLYSGISGTSCILAERFRLRGIGNVGYWDHIVMPSANAQTTTPPTPTQGASKLDAMPKELQKIDVKQGTGAEADGRKSGRRALHRVALRPVETRQEGEPNSTARAIAANRSTFRWAAAASSRVGTRASRA